MASKSTVKNWVYISYDTNSQNLGYYAEVTDKELFRVLKKLECKYNAVEWRYCDNPYK